MNEKTPVFIRREAVDSCLKDKWNILVSLIENALKSYSLGKVVQPVRTIVPVDKHNGRLLTMPAYDEDSDCLATKIVTVYPDNKRESVPTIQSVILLYDASHGKLKAILDAEVITNMRTAAASMTATKYLAPKDSKHLSLIGAGSQARSHYQVMKHFIDLKKVSVWNLNRESGEKLVEEIRASGKQSEYCSRIEDAVKDADIINVVTMATQPILMKKWIKEGAHINAVGAPFPDWQELEEDLMHSAVVYVDSIEGAKKESGDVIKSGAKIYAEIGEVIAGNKEAFYDKITVFKSLDQLEKSMVIMP